MGLISLLSGYSSRYFRSLTFTKRLGYPDFYPSKGNEEEYKLTEKAITDGFENKSVVAVSPNFDFH
jgi:hypothetical protein